MISPELWHIHNTWTSFLILRMRTSLPSTKRLAVDMLPPATTVYCPASDIRVDGIRRRWTYFSFCIFILWMKWKLRLTYDGSKEIGNSWNVARQNNWPVHYLQLLAVLHPLHGDVRLRNFAFKHGSLLLENLNVLNVLPEFNMASWKRECKQLIFFIALLRYNSHPVKSTHLSI